MRKQASRPVREQHSGQRQGKRSAGGRRSKVLETETMLSLEEAYHGARRLIRLKGRTIKVTISPGVAEGQILRMAQNGRHKPGGDSNGDLYLTIRIAPHQEFRRIGNDLYRDLQLESHSPLIGSLTHIKTLTGKVKVRIPKNIANGKKIILRKHGMPVYAKQNKFGNLLVNVIIRTDQLKDEQVDLLGTLGI